MSKQLLRVGIVGTGFGVNGHLPAWKQVEGAQVTAICSRSQARASALAEKHGIAHAFSDAAALAAHPEVDLVVASGTPAEHVEQVAAAAKAGKAVLCEKPLGIDAGMAAPMLRAVEAAGVPNFMNFEFRCRPAVQAALRLIQDGALGDIHHAELTAHMPFLPAAQAHLGGWWFDRAQGGGWLLAHGSHQVDLLWMLVGPITSVSAELSTNVKRPVTRDGEVESTVDDTYALQLRFANGATGTCVSCATAGPKTPLSRIAILGSGGQLVIDDDRLLYSKTGAPLAEQPLDEAASGAGYGPMVLWARKLTAALQSGQRLEPDLAQGMAVQRVLDAAIQSSATGGRLWIG